MERWQDSFYNESTPVFVPGESPWTENPGRLPGVHEVARSQTGLNNYAQRSESVLKSLNVNHRTSPTYEDFVNTELHRPLSPQRAWWEIPSSSVKSMCTGSLDYIAPCDGAGACGLTQPPTLGRCLMRFWFLSASRLVEREGTALP